MTMGIIGKLGEIGIIPVIKIDNKEHVTKLADALMSAGLPCAEITLRTQCAEEAIQKMVVAQPEMLVGVGTVLTLDQAKQAISSGAKFVVTPGLNPLVIDYCLEQGVVIIPGVATPTEAMLAMSQGLSVLKFFPAQALGGIQFLQAISPALPGASFIPTGGINAENMEIWLKLPIVHAVAGSWIASSNLLNESKFDMITHLARHAVEHVKSARQIMEGK
ncbi:MAG: bifunctional 4-hydroxy-2-oxoglutarate aldolase/2-dehydro-3-deoxy-phosphogluconate aldolase [Anaerolineaceae bacterium]